MVARFVARMQRCGAPPGTRYNRPRRNGRWDPQVIGADENQVVILYHQRGVSPSGERFDGEVIGLYEVRDFKLSRAQMFYFDEAALARFLQQAAQELKETKR